MRAASYKCFKYVQRVLICFRSSIIIVINEQRLLLVHKQLQSYVHQLRSDLTVSFEKDLSSVGVCNRPSKCQSDKQVIIDWINEFIRIKRRRSNNIENNIMLRTGVEEGCSSVLLLLVFADDVEIIAVVVRS